MNFYKTLKVLAEYKLISEFTREILYSNFLSNFIVLKLLKNSIIAINKTTSIGRFHETETKWKINYSTTLLFLCMVMEFS
ncbi:hypothetical protein LEP1GSC021_4023 [Leptospira noguchii str. 1993005606]|nr:hypothetical protein LEP1GSC021_4023 [Leptospira noguchii str. 1993005606]